MRKNIGENVDFSEKNINQQKNIHMHLIARNKNLHSHRQPYGWAPSNAVKQIKKKAVNTTTTKHNKTHLITRMKTIPRLVKF